MDSAEGKPPKSALEIRKKVLADPNTAQIAEKLGVPLEQYVERVVYFAMNPQALPEYLVVSDEVLAEKFGLGPTLKTPEILAIFEREVEYATVAQKTDYRTPKEKLVDLSQAPAAETTIEDTQLKEDLKKQLLGKKGGKA
jgi:hypothetical protein